MKNYNTNIDAIRKLMAELKNEKYAFVNLDLASLDEYGKTLYLKVLCSVIQYQNEPTEAQILFLKRIIKGIGVDNSAEECMRMALEISEMDMKEFLSFFKEKTVKFYFMTDGLIILKLGNGTTDEYEYFAELIELLDVKKADLEYICMVVKSILQQDAIYFNNAKDLLTENVCTLDFTPYICNYYAGVSSDSDMMVHYCAPEKKLSQNIDYPNFYNQRKIVFENLDIMIMEDWEFYSCESVSFKNCNISSGSGAISFDSVGTIEFIGCKISDFSKRVAYAKNINNFIVDNCEIRNCEYMCDGDARGGVFFIKSEKLSILKKVDIKDTKLLNCNIVAARMRYNYGVSGVLIGFSFVDECTNVTVTDNEFIGCQCINNGNYQEAIIGTMFNEANVKQKNNQCTGSLLRLFEDDEYENNR